MNDDLCWLEVFILILLCFPVRCIAGELDFPIRTTVPLSYTTAMPKLWDADLNLDLVTPTIWKFGFKDQSLALTQMNISAAGTGDYDSFDIDIMVPFNWEKEQIPIEIGLAFSDDDPYNGDTDSFLNSASNIGSLSVPDELLLFARGERIFRLRYQDLNGRLPNKDDVRVAYWVLVSDRDLGERINLKEDQTVDDAISWLNSTINSTPRLFRSNTVTITDVQTVSHQISEQDEIIYSNLNQSVSSMLASNSQDDLNYVCPKALSIFTALNSLPPDQRKSYNSDFANNLTASTNAAICLARIFAVAKLKGQPFEQDEVDDAYHVIEAIKNPDQSADTAWQKDEQTALKRLNDLSQFMPPSTN